MLLEKGADVNVRMKQTHWTPLMLASLNGHKRVVELLVSHGADTNAIHVLDQTAADVAQAAGHRSIEAYLNKHTSSPSRHILKRSAQHDIFEATKKDDFDQVKRLLAGYDNVNRLDEDGASCIMLEAMRADI